MKKKTKLQPTFAIYNFPYFNRNRNAVQLFAAKTLLILLTCMSGAYYFTTKLLMPDTAVWAAVAAGLTCVIYLVLLSLFRKLYVDLFTVGSCVILGFFFREQIYKIGKQFIYQVLIAANGSIVDTSRLTALHKNPEAQPMLIILCIIFGIVCAFSLYRRYHPEGLLAFCAIMLVPSFLSLQAGFDFSLAVFTAGNLGLWAMSSSLNLNAVLVAGGAVNTYAMDSEYRKMNKKLPLKKRFAEDSFNYGKYFQDGFMTALIAVLTVSIVAASFPEDGSLKFDEVIKNVVKGFENIGSWGDGFFPSFGQNSSSFKGFFSADGGSINISNSIDSSNAGHGEAPVLEVFTQNQDKLYLKGDVGYRFDGRNWDSISGIDYSKLYYKQYGESLPVEDIFKNYIPELELLNARSFVANPGQVINSQTVKINYLAKMNTVLFPGTPFICNFRDNKDFTVKGDFVALAQMGRIKSMETAVLYQRSDYAAELLTAQEIGVDASSISYAANLSENSYTNYLNAYIDYVYGYYTEVPENEKENIEYFLKECFNSSLELYDVTDNLSAITSLYEKDDIAGTINRYLSSGNEYKYSIAVNNFSGSNTPIGTFLKDTKRGHCAMYASTMCLALRYLGIPARYVTGFTVGGGRPAESTGSGYKYTLAGKDLHAWVEVYYDKIGWLPYDPTPAAYINYNPAADTEPAVTQTITSQVTQDTLSPDESETTTDISQEQSSQTGDNPNAGTTDENGQGGAADYTFIKVILIILGSLVLIFALFMSVRGGLRSLVKKEKSLFKFFKSGDGARAVKKMLDLSLRLMKVKGVIRKPGETPEEFGARADEELKLGGMLTEAIPLFEREEFDRSPQFTAEEQRQLYIFTKKLTRKVLGEMKNPKRLITRIILFARTKN